MTARFQEQLDFKALKAIYDSGQVLTILSELVKRLKVDHSHRVVDIALIHLPLNKPLAVCSLLPKGVSNPAVAMFKEANVTIMLEKITKSEVVKEPSAEVWVSKYVSY